MKLSVSLQKQFSGFDISCDFTTHANRVGIFGSSGSGKSIVVWMTKLVERYAGAEASWPGSSRAPWSSRRAVPGGTSTEPYETVVVRHAGSAIAAAIREQGRTTCMGGQ